MRSLWIVHRNPRTRAAIARLAAATDDAVSGAPSDPVFDEAPPADVVLLGPVEDYEAELQFAHRVGPRLCGARWILLPLPGQAARVRRLFDSLDAEILDYPPEVRRLREQLSPAAAPSAAQPLPLSQRAARDALSERFGRWFADFDAPELLRALEPRLADVPLLILGEPGTGRGLLARYVHTFGASATGAFAHAPCAASTTAGELLAAVRAGSDGARGRLSCTVWLEDVDALSPVVQRQLRCWIELEPPEGLFRTAQVRWIASGGDPNRLEPGLAHALSGVAVRLPPVRERPQIVASFANVTTQTWCATHGDTPRRFGEDAIAVLEEHPWPGNLRELETVIIQSLAAGAGDPVRSDDLRYDGAPFAPLSAETLGTTLDEPGAGQGEEEWELAEALTAELETSEAPTGEPDFIPAELAADEAPEPGPPAKDDALRRLAGAIAHEVRNPLTTIRTFAELLPERHKDEAFRTRFAELVDVEVRRISAVVDELSRLAEFEAPDREPVDATAMLEELLEQRRERIRERRLLVLKELELERPDVLCDPEQLRFALESLLDRAFDLVPERGDVYFASKRHDLGSSDAPSVRILVRLQGAPGPGPAEPVPGTRVEETALDFALAEAVLRAQGGTLAVDSGESETILIVDLPAPA